MTDKPPTTPILERINHALYTTGVDSVACFSLTELRHLRDELTGNAALIKLLKDDLVAEREINRALRSAS